MWHRACRYESTSPVSYRQYPSRGSRRAPSAGRASDEGGAAREEVVLELTVEAAEESVGQGAAADVARGQGGQQQRRAGGPSAVSSATPPSVVKFEECHRCAEDSCGNTVRDLRTGPLLRRVRVRLSGPYRPGRVLAARRRPAHRRRRNRRRADRGVCGRRLCRADPGARCPAPGACGVAGPHAGACCHAGSSGDGVNTRVGPAPACDATTNISCGFATFPAHGKDAGIQGKRRNA